MTATPFQHIVVAGAGAWGTALAISLARAGHKTSIWTRNENVRASIAGSGVNEIYLPGLEVPSSIAVSTDPGLVAEADGLLSTVPTQYMRKTLPTLRAACRTKEVPVLLSAKGIEQSSGQFVHEILRDVWPEAGAAILSGPSFAADVASGLPTAVTLSDADRERARRWQLTLGTQSFRPYLSDDLLGVALGGAVKNVLAIACGIVEGRALGESAKAALMARGFAEILRLADAVGANRETLHGLSGLGDIILTCSSQQSRNFSLGYEIGRGRTVSDVLAGRVSVAEGAATAPVLRQKAAALGVDMPIVDAVAALVEGNQTATNVVAQLMSRPLKSNE
ncbi:MAG: NAD(P)H-dependent glycerol-3-phosphate dehydrogenase [Parvularcula sp.]